MIKILNKMFEANPEKPTIAIKDICSDCGCETNIEITPTSGGFGLQGGILFKRSHDRYLAKCPDCHEENPKKDDSQKSWKKFIKILLVEDDLSSRRILNLFLSSFGKIDIAVNSNEAITAVKKGIENNEPYELIFLDITMPELVGISTLKKIRQLETQHGVYERTKSRIIMTSANTEKDVILKAARADCTSYKIKPIDKTLFYKEIRKHGFNIPKNH